MTLQIVQGMETKKTILQIMMVLITTPFLANCSPNSYSGGGGSSSPTYYLSNGICYSSATSQPVATTYCNSTCGTNTGYTLNGNGMCYSTATGQQVATSFCTSSSTYPYTSGYGTTANSCGTAGSGYGYPVTSGYTSPGYVGTGFTGYSGYSAGIGVGVGVGVGVSQCYGTFYSQNGQAGVCNGSNCSGYILYNTSGVLVYCP
jgi:hypothetical protein